MEAPVPGFFRLVPGGEVRLKFAFCIICKDVIKDADGNLVELRCTYDDATRHGRSPKGVPRSKESSTGSAPPMRWMPKCAFTTACSIVEQPDGGDGDFLQHMNPGSLEVIKAKVDRSRTRGQACIISLSASATSSPIPWTAGKIVPVFNRTVGLKDAFSQADGQSVRCCTSTFHR